MIIEIYGETLKWDNKNRVWVSEEPGIYADQLNVETMPFSADPNPELTALREAKRWYPALKVVEKAKQYPIEYVKGVEY